MARAASSAAPPPPSRPDSPVEEVDEVRVTLRKFPKKENHICI